MTFEENPFRVLQVSIYDDKAAINERVDELSFEDPDREKNFEQARTILLNPKKRIAAEVQWFVSKELFFSGSIFPWLTAVDKNFSAQKPEALRKKINKARSESKFPAVEDAAEIKAALKNIRYEIRKMIQDEFRVNNQRVRVNFTNRFVEEVLRQISFGVIVEDFFELYRLEMNPFLDDVAKQIIVLLNKIKINPHTKFLYDLEGKLDEFGKAQKPLDKISFATGTNKFKDSEKIFYSVRSTAVKLHNEKKLIDEPLKIFQMLEKSFSHLPTLAELIRKDIKFLEEEKARRPTKSFLDAKAALDKIQAEMDKNLHFEKGFERTNLNFYEEVFKKDYVFDLIRVMNHTVCKQAERKELCALTAAIYIQIGNALTWTSRADFALDCFKKALPYAKASGNVELISLAGKRIDEWEKINEQIAANSKEDSSGCIWWIIIIVVLILLTR